MPTYAVLGGTGNCGSALIRNLLQQSSNNKIHVYCRNEEKLRQMLPLIDVSNNNRNIQVFAGSMLDVDLMAACLQNALAAFLVVSTNDNVPGCCLSQNLVRTVVQALEKLRDGHYASSHQADFRPPRLILLSSASIDDHLSAHTPKLIRSLLLRASSNVYEDLRQAEALLRSHSDWLTVIFVKPAGLSLDVSRGYRLTFDEEESFLSYEDLASGMIEVASDERGLYDGRNIGVVNKSANARAKFPKGTPVTLLMGLLRHFFPALHPYLPSGGPA